MAVENLTTKTKINPLCIAQSWLLFEKISSSPMNFIVIDLDISTPH